MNYKINMLDISSIYIHKMIINHILHMNDINYLVDDISMRSINDDYMFHISLNDACYKSIKKYIISVFSTYYVTYNSLSDNYHSADVLQNSFIINDFYSYFAVTPSFQQLFNINNIIKYIDGFDLYVYCNRYFNTIKVENKKKGRKQHLTSIVIRDNIGECLEAVFDSHNCRLFRLFVNDENIQPFYVRKTLESLFIMKILFNRMQIETASFNNNRSLLSNIKKMISPKKISEISELFDKAEIKTTNNKILNHIFMGKIYKHLFNIDNTIGVFLGNLCIIYLYLHKLPIETINRISAHIFLLDEKFNHQEIKKHIQTYLQIVSFDVLSYEDTMYDFLESLKNILIKSSLINPEWKSFEINKIINIFEIPFKRILNHRKNKCLYVLNSMEKKLHTNICDMNIANIIESYMITPMPDIRMINTINTMLK